MFEWQRTLPFSEEYPNELYGDWKPGDSFFAGDIATMGIGSTATPDPTTQTGWSFGGSPVQWWEHIVFPWGAARSIAYGFNTDKNFWSKGFEQSALNPEMGGSQAVMGFLGGGIIGLIILMMILKRR